MGTQFMTEKENNFWAKTDCFALGKSDMGKKDLPEQEIFSIRRPNGSIHGPFVLSQLKDTLQEYSSWRELAIRPLNKHYWIPLGEHPLFDQRASLRKNLLQSITPESENIYLNIKGQTSGPYSFREIEKKVLSKELLPGDLVNPDPSQQLWIRLFEIQHFNSQKNLPDMPRSHLFDNRTKIPNKKVVNQGQTDAIVNLAQLEKKIKSDSNPVSSSLYNSSTFSESMRRLWKGTPFVIVGITLLTVVLATTLPLFNRKPPPAKVEKSKKKSFFVNKAKKRPTTWTNPPPSPPPTVKTKPKPRKFFPIKSPPVFHKKTPPEPPPYEEYGEDIPHPQEPPVEQDNREENVEDLINAIEDTTNKNRNPSSSPEDGDGEEGLGEIHDDGELAQEQEEDIEFISIPFKNSDTLPDDGYER